MSTEPCRNAPPAPFLDEVRQRVSTRALSLTLLSAWWPALLWAAFIFVMSTDSFSSAHTSRFFEPLLRWLFPPLTAGQFEIIHHIIRKSAHFVEYFIFFLLLYRGVRITGGARAGWHWSWALWAWLIAAGYSALDEVHQIFVPSRGPSAWDSLLDSTGALIALLVVFCLYRRIVRSRPDSSSA
jgi:VanZ family protein